MSRERVEDFETEFQKNRLLLDTIEPGSTFKVVTIAAALKSDINPMKEYNVEGPYNFHNIKMIEDSEPNSVLTVDVIATALPLLSNTEI